LQETMQSLGWPGGSRICDDTPRKSVGRKRNLSCPRCASTPICRANGINAHTYLTYLYEHLPRAVTVADLEALLPWNVKPLLKATPAARTP